MFLIDTDVLSTLRKRKRHPEIAQWVEKQRSADLYLSVVSVGEIERGIERQQRRDPVHAHALAAWLDSLLAFYTASGFLPSTCRRRAGGAACPVSSAMKVPIC